MLTGMTGFGRVEKGIPGGKLIVELRSLNHRFFEVVFHMPESMISFEEELKKTLATGIRRGRVTCLLNFEPVKNGTVLNIDLAKSYVKEVKRLKKAIGLTDDVRLETILHLPGVMSPAIGRQLLQKNLAHIKGVVKDALSQLVKMRQKEGRAIAVDFNRRLDSITRELKLIRAKIQQIIKERKKKISNPDELGAFLKNIDITEEVIRMDYHLKNFKNQVNRLSCDGKELDFIAQELQRETNTISAKSVDALVSTSAVKIKSQVEKLREQLQNVE